jgi:TolA-binding protein
MMNFGLLEILILIPFMVVFALVVAKVVQALGFAPQNRNVHLQEMEHKVRELQQRVENLETIITSIDADMLDGIIKLQNTNNPRLTQKKVEQFAQNAQNKSEVPLDENFKMVLNKILMKVDNFLEDKGKP